MSDPVEDEGGVDEITPAELGLLPTDIPAPNTTAAAAPQPSAVAKLAETTLAAAAVFRQQKRDEAKRTYQLLTIEEVFAMQSPKWAVKGVIRIGEIGALYGVPGCCKTFVALDLALHIATGTAWWGNRVTKGSVLYLAGEGARGMKRRIAAWTTERQVDHVTLDMRVLPHSIRFLEPAEFSGLVEAIRKLPNKPILIVIDTLARYFNGEENSAAEIGEFVELATKLREETGAAILLVHHEGKGQKGLRGSSALHGALDVTIRVEKDKDLVTIAGDKSKDDAPLRPLYFKTKFVWLGLDDDGDTAGSLVLERTEPPIEENADDAKSGGALQPTEIAKPDHGTAIRKTLATVFAGRASGGPLRDASGLASSTFYEVLEAEIDADRIRTKGGRYPTYELTDAAPEYVSPSPSSSPEGNLDSESGRPSESERRESESEPDTLSLKRVSEGSESESRSDVAHSRPHQKKKQKRAKTTKPERKRHPKPHQDASKAASEQSPAQSPGVPSSAESDAASGGKEIDQ